MLWLQVEDGLVPLIAKLREGTSPDTSVIAGDFDTAAQSEVCNGIVKQLGFELNRGRLDVSVHPFTGGTRLAFSWAPFGLADKAPAFIRCIDVDKHLVSHQAYLLIAVSRCSSMQCIASATACKRGPWRKPASVVQRSPLQGLFQRSELSQDEGWTHGTVMERLKLPEPAFRPDLIH